MIRKVSLFLALCLYAVILSELSSSEVFASELKSEKATVKMTPEAYLEQYLDAFNNLDADAAFNLWLHEGDINWELIVKDIVIGKPSISSGGATAKYPVRFHVYARFLPGGIGLWETIDFGIVNDYGTAYAE